MEKNRVLGCVVGCMLVAGATATTQATPVILQDGPSFVTIDPASQAGQSVWCINTSPAVNQLNQEWFWYRVGDSGPERSLDTLGVPSVYRFNSNPDNVNVPGAFNSLYVQYVTPGFIVELNYTLTGSRFSVPGTSFSSDLVTTIRITNTTNDVLPFHLFDYADFDLNGSASGDSVQFPSSNVVRQTKGSAWCVETVFTPGASHKEANLDSQTLTSLNDGQPTTLNGNVASGPGNTTWALEWDSNIAPFASLLISKDEQITPTPEPATALLMLASVGVLCRRSRR